MNTRRPCPKCRANGGDGKGDNLQLRGDWWRCYSCGHYESADEPSDEVPAYPLRRATSSDDDTLDAIKEYPHRAWGPISVETMRHFGVRTGFDSGGFDARYHYYPYGPQAGTVTGYKVRDIPSKSFRVVGKVSGLFGQSVSRQAGKFIIITEGEKDCLAAHEMLVGLGRRYNVLSLPNGASTEGKVDRVVSEQMEWLAGFDTVVLAFDADAPGRAMAGAVADMLCAESEVKVAAFSDGYKDSFDYLEADKAVEWWQRIEAAETYRPESVVEGKTITLEEIMRPREPGIMLPFPGLNAMTMGIFKGQVTTITAAPGLGKTTLVREIGYHLHNLGYTVANIMLETEMQMAVQYYMAMDNNIPAYRLLFAKESNSVLDPAQQQASYDKLIVPNRLHFMRHWGSIDCDTLIRKMRYYVRALNTDFIILDHVSMVVVGDEDERKSIDKLFESMNCLCVETGVGIIAVIHLKRVGDKRNLAGGGEVQLTDLRGSAGAEQMSWAIWALERNLQGEGEEQDTMTIRVLKSRVVGKLGKADRLLYQHDTGRLVPIGRATDYL